MAADDTRHPPALIPPPVAADGGLSNSLLLQCLGELTLLGRALSVTNERIARTETQNETIIAAQSYAESSREKMHKRINEISVNVASVESEVGELKDLKPIVTMLRDAHIERSVVRRVLAAICRNGYARVGAAAVAGGTVWTQWESLVALVRRVVGAKVGSP